MRGVLDDASIPVLRVFDMLYSINDPRWPEKVLSIPAFSSGKRRLHGPGTMCLPDNCMFGQVRVRSVKCLLDSIAALSILRIIDDIELMSTLYADSLVFSAKVEDDRDYLPRAVAGAAAARKRKRGVDTLASLPLLPAETHDQVFVPDEQVAA